MADANIDFLLSEEKAYWYKESNVLGLLPDGGLVREWRNIPVQHRDECIATLKSRRKEENPKVQGVAHEGVYRITSIDDVLVAGKDGRVDSYTIRETLALGLATTIDTALNVSRIGEDNANPGAGTTWPASPAHTGTSPIQQPIRALTLKWVNIDPTALEAIRAARSSVTETTLTVNGESLTGPWYKTKIVTSQDVDGSGIYSEVWALGETAFESVAAKGDRELSANRVIINVPKGRVATVLNAEIAALGAKYKAAGYTYTQRVNWSGDTAEISTEATEDYEKSDSNTSETSKSNTTVRSVYKDTDSIPDASTAAQGVVRKVVGDITPTGDFEYVAETDTAIKQEIKSFTAEISASKTTTEKSGVNLYDADIGAYAITLTTGHKLQLEKRVQPDGTFAAVVRDTVATNQTASTDGTHSDRHYDDDAKTIDAVVNTAEAVPAADVPFTTQGTVTDVKNTPNDDGTFRTDVETTVSKKQEITSFTAKATAAETITEKSGKQLHDADLYDASVTAAQGHVITLEKRENNDGTFDEVFRDALSIDQTATATSPSTTSDQHLDTNDRTEDTVRHTAAAAALDDVAYATQGVLVETVSKPNPDGTFETEAKTTTSKEQEIDDEVVAADTFRVVRADIGKNIRTIATNYAVAATTGEIQTRTISKNPDGTFEVDRKRDIAVTVEAAESSEEKSAFETVTRVVDRNNTDGDTPPVSQTAGSIVSVVNKTNDYGRVDVTVDTRTAVPRSTSFASQSAKLTTEATVVDRNADVKANASGGGSGTVVQVKSALNEFLKYDNETVTKTAVADSQTQTVESNAFAATVATKKRNAAALEAGTGGGSGTIVKASGQINEFGLFDTDKEVTTPVANVTAGGDKVAAADSVLTGTTTRNVASPAAAPSFTAGQIDVQRKRLTEAGLWDVEASTDVRQDLSISGVCVVKTPRMTSAVTIVDGAESVPSALGDNAFGSIIVRKDRYGRYVGEKRVDTYNDKITIPGWELASRHYDVVHTARFIVGRKGYKRDITYTISVLQSNSPGACISHIDGGLVGTEAGSSRYEALANGQYKATKITLKTAGAVTADSGGNLP